jgi:hypothetical protein
MLTPLIFENHTKANKNGNPLFLELGSQDLWNLLSTRTSPIDQLVPVDQNNTDLQPDSRFQPNLDQPNFRVSLTPGSANLVRCCYS